MKRARLWIILGIIVGCVLLSWVLVTAQQPAIVPPFATTPFTTAYTGGINTSITLYARHLNGSYESGTLGILNPHALVAAATSIAGFLSEGLGNLIAAPGGPPNIGRGSALISGGKFSSSAAVSLALLDTFHSTVNVYLGSTSLSYTGGAVYPVGVNAESMIVTDLNGDSVMDIAVSYQGDSSNNIPGGISILLAKGDGTFSPAVNYPVGVNPTGFAAFDVNHDNILDLVVADNFSTSVYVLTGNANGTFNAAVAYPVAAIGGSSVTIADFNGDGNPDIAAAYFGDQTTPGGVDILINNGNGTFHAGGTLPVGGNPFFVAAGDFNGDTKLDLAVLDQYAQTITMYRGDGTAHFQKTSSYVTGPFADNLILTDYNQDGILDVLVGEGDSRLFGGTLYTGNIDVLLGRGDGTFQGAAVSNTGLRCCNLTFTVVGDFNGDGIPDAVANDYFATAGKNLYLFPGDGSGAFAANPTSITIDPTGTPYPNSAVVGDFNGDGKSDLALVLDNPTRVGILLSNGSGFGPLSIVANGTGNAGIATADFDGDGKLDLAITDSNAATTTIYHGLGSGAFQLAHTYATGTSPHLLKAVDLNGDGHPDLVVVDSGSNGNGTVDILMNNGSGGFATPVLVSLGSGASPGYVTAGDVNGDGIMDLAVSMYGMDAVSEVAILKGNGDGTFQSPTFVPILVGYAPGDLVLRDFNGDGKSDLVLARFDGPMTYLQSNGDGTFSAEVAFNGPQSVASINIADLNRDGAPDIVVGDSYGGVSGLLNTTPAGNFPCQLSSTTLQPSAAGGNITVTINSGSCGLGVTNLPSWITVASTNASGVTLAIAANTGGARSVNISIGSVSVAVNQAAPPACSYSLNAGGEGFTAAGGNGSVNISVNPGCPWTATSPPSWITFTSGASGSGAATFTFQASANSGGARSVSFTVAGVSFNVQQEAASVSGLSFVGSMAHLAAEENWTTTFTLVNKNPSAAMARLSFAGDAVVPAHNGPLMLPLVFPQQTSASGPLLAASFDQALAANASLIVSTGGPQTPPVLVGSAQLAATGAVDGFAIFHQIVTTQEAVVPMETRNASSYLLAFDNTNGLVLGVAVENVSSQNAVIPVIIRDDTGAVISSPGTTISLGGNGHTSFVLSDPTAGFPVTANLRGTIEFDTPAGGQISVLGLRFTPPNNSLTTIPALASVGTGGGSIAHLASGGDGWQTTFVLVNTGSGSAPTTLSFFNDQTGLPLSLPLTFPQGSIADTTAPSVTQTLAAGATLVMVSGGVTPTLFTGSAQLTTTGLVSGFVIFRHNGQEAVVPLESRNANAYILAFDNTNGTATGVAVNSVSAQAVNIPVVVRDDAGNQLATDTIAMAANGHYAFTLVSDRYPATANIRGTIEFDKPAGAQIGALGIRIPTGAAHTYTTLPALAK